MQKASKLLLCLTFSMIFFFNTSAGTSSDEIFLGVWKGDIQIAQQNVPVIFKISSSRNHEITATMDSPAQGVTDLPVSKVTINGDQLTLEITVASAVYTGTYDHETHEVAGNWTQAGRKFNLTLTKEVSTSPEAAQAGANTKTSFLEEHIEFENPSASIKLAGTLTLPKNKQADTAVVLITGSGPQGRDQSFMGHKTFKVLAEYLTEQGIAVLRFDDRGVGKSEGNFFAATSLDFATDVSAAVDYLKQQGKLKFSSIGLIGHSEGGLIAPLVASERDDIAFIVMLAGPGISGREIAESQIERFLSFNGFSEETASAGKSITSALNSVVINNEDRTTLADDLSIAYTHAWNKLPENAQVALKKVGGGSLSEARRNELMLPWTKFFLKHDPAIYLSKLDMPILALHGGKDTQMRADRNLAAIQKSLKPETLKISSVQKIEEMNHLFQTANTGLISEYASIKETMSPIVLQTISEWIHRQ